MNNYEDIINIYNHEPGPKHPRMSIYNRSAQFAPFAALTGYNESISETSRIVDSKIFIDDYIKEQINEILNILDNSSIKIATITYFIKDKYKNGGIYKTIREEIKKIDKYNKKLILKNNEIILFNDIIDIDNN